MRPDPNSRFLEFTLENTYMAVCLFECCVSMYFQCFETMSY